MHNSQNGHVMHHFQKRKLINARRPFCELSRKKNSFKKKIPLLYQFEHQFEIDNGQLFFYLLFDVAQK